ncbi:MAG: 2-oxoacid:acceptor oxidoreductase subunit alpha [Thermoplasmata archaeon]|nr:MAG: 2-oxoacid:acceptor oxidoreductase subunit alpha [Thermoplasmata archaeon]
MKPYERYFEKIKDKKLFLLGNEAVVYGALSAGCNFFAGYPITPSTEIASMMSRELPKVGGYYIQMEDEIASIAAVIGASWAGGKSMTATSGPGFSLMMENIGYACMTETPCVIVDVQRSGPSTGQATKPAQGDVMQSRWGTHGDHEIIVLSPNSVQECFELTVESFNLSETYRTPVILLMDGKVGHLTEQINIPSEIQIVERRKAKEDELPFGGQLIPPMIEIGDRRAVHITGSTHMPDGMRDIESQDVHDRLVRRLYRKIDENRENIVRVEENYEDNARIAVVSYGATARLAFGAVLKARENGIPVDFLRLITIWPFPRDRIRKLGEKVDRIYVPELNLGQISREIERFVDIDVISLSKIGGVHHTVDEIYNAIRGE